VPTCDHAPPFAERSTAWPSTLAAAAFAVQDTVFLESELRVFDTPDGAEGVLYVVPVVAYAEFAVELYDLTRYW
jgi:hypothetical protein